MTKKEIAAVLNVAWLVAGSDDMSDDEWMSLTKEIKTFTRDAEVFESIKEEFGDMDPLEAINIIRNSGEAVKREAHALIIVTVAADDDISDEENGAYKILCTLCDFGQMTFAEAHEVVGF